MPEGTVTPVPRTVSMNTALAVGSMLVQIIVVVVSVAGLYAEIRASDVRQSTQITDLTRRVDIQRNEIDRLMAEIATVRVNIAECSAALERKQR